MTPLANTERYKNHRFPGEIISHGVWLYYRFSLSYREVQELLFERGITVSHEAISGWCQKFGQDYANRLRRRRPVAYLLAADKYFGPLASRLNSVNQPVVRSRNGFSAPHPAQLACI
jgi:hypothetical protein